MVNNTEILSRVLAGTKTAKRDIDLFSLANDIVALKTDLGSMDKVAEIVGISSGMLNRFLKVFKLDIEIQELVKNKKITSISVVDSLSKFSTEEQKIIFNKLKFNELDNQSLKFLSPLRNQFKDEKIEKLITRLVSSKDKSISVIHFIPDNIEDIIRQKLLNILIANNNLISIEIKEEVGTIKLSKIGEKLLREEAKKQKLTFEQLILTITQ